MLLEIRTRQFATRCPIIGRIVKTQPVASLVDCELLPGPEVKTDTDLEAAISRRCPHVLRRPFDGSEVKRLFITTSVRVLG